MKLIQKDKAIFDYKPASIKLKLTTATNKALLESFTDTFYALGAYQPQNELETSHLLELSKVFIDEFRGRLRTYQRKKDKGAIEELAKILQNMLMSNQFEIPENDNEEGFVYMVNNTLRLYAECIRVMKRIGVDPAYLKKHYQ